MARSDQSPTPEDTADAADVALPGLDHWFVRDLAGLYLEWQPSPAPEPSLIALNTSLAVELGLDPSVLSTADGLAVFAGNRVPNGAVPIAMSYAGHQFGGYSPRLGDGRALLLGEVVLADGSRRDVHLKGSGRTPFARGGDGKAAIGPMLREYLVAEAMHALGVPTTRALAVAATGEYVMRDAALPGAVLTRIAASHIRVGTFEYAARLEDRTAIVRLADHAIARHHPSAVTAANPYLALLESVAEAQAALIAQWMLVGFIHGVMNTDNMTISGEGIDYGPCAFMDRYDPRTVYSSIDHGGRYAYGNQPNIAQWNLARLAETLLSLIDDDPQAAVASATAVLEGFPARFDHHWQRGMRAKLGLPPTGDADGDRALFEGWLDLLGTHAADYTGSFRALAAVLRGDPSPLRALLGDGDDVHQWLDTWRSRVAADGDAAVERADAMDRVNPLFIPRNHHLERVLAAATEGDITPFEEMLAVVTRPFEPQVGSEAYALPAPVEFALAHQTFCGT